LQFLFYQVTPQSRNNRSLFPLLPNDHFLTKMREIKALNDGKERTYV
jgi:hypothetical protein